MRKIVLPTALLLTGLGAGFYLGSGGLQTVAAQSPETYKAEGAWGSVKGSLGNRMLVFEDDSGVIRIVDLAKYNVTTKMLDIERVIERR